MALLNPIESTETGLLLEEGYWRIGALWWDYQNPRLFRARFDGYASLDAFQGGKTAIASIASEFAIDSPQELELFNQLRTLLYQKAVQEIPHFRGSA